LKARSTLNLRAWCSWTLDRGAVEGASTRMARRYGRAPKGERCRAPVPHGHWKTTTFAAGLRLNGIVAPLVLDGPMTGAAFLAYVEQMLAPTLVSGDIVVMDTGQRRCPGRRTRSAACVRRLRPLAPWERRSQPLPAAPRQRRCRAPDFNPIEMAFAKLKALLRGVAARTIPALWQAIAAALDRFTPSECQNYFVAAGYEPE
jgi:transposase